MLWSIHLDGGPRRVNHAAVALNGAIYSFGGYCSNEQSDGTEPIDIHMLNTSNYRWKRVYHANVTENENSIDDTVDLDGGDGRNKELNKQLPYMRYGHTVVEYRGKAYLWGGRNDEYGASSQLHEFDPNTRLWRLVPVQNRFPPARDGHSAVVWGHKMYIFGGFEEEAQRFSQETYVYDFPTSRWSLFNTTGPLPLWRDFHTAVQIDGTMYVFGGRSDITGEFHSTRDTYDDRLMALDLKTGLWREVNVGYSKKPNGRRSHSAWVYNNRMYIFGGYQGSINRHYNDIYCFDPATSQWTQICTRGLIPSPRRRQCTVVVGDRLFLFGGTRPSDSPYGLPVVVDRPTVPVRLRAVAANVDADEDDEPQVHLPFAPAPTPQAVPRLNDLADLYVLEFVPTLKNLALYKFINQPNRTCPKLCRQKVPCCIIDEIFAMTTPNKISTNLEPDDRRVAAG